MKQQQQRQVADLLRQACEIRVEGCPIAKRNFSDPDGDVSLSARQNAQGRIVSYAWCFTPEALENAVITDHYIRVRDFTGEECDIILIAPDQGGAGSGGRLTFRSKTPR